MSYSGVIHRYRWKPYLSKKHKLSHLYSKYICMHTVETTYLPTVDWSLSIVHRRLNTWWLPFTGVHARFICDRRALYNRTDPFMVIVWWGKRKTYIRGSWAYKWDILVTIWSDRLLHAQPDIIHRYSIGLSMTVLHKECNRPECNWWFFVSNVRIY